MSRRGYCTPVRLWRAFLFAGILIPAVWAGPPSQSIRPPPDYVQWGKPDQAEGARILQEFRQLGLAGDYYLDFQLRVLPRRGDEKDFRGRFWGSRTAQGPVSRVELFDAKGAVHRLLIQNGVTPQVWSWRDGQDAVEAPSLDHLFEPLLPGTELTLFDLEMPYLYWNDFVFEGVSKVRGRPAHTFLLYPPPEIAAKYPELKGVRVQLDTQYHALVQSQLINADNRPYKSFTVLDLKKISDQWMVKMIDLRNEETRNKTRFQVTAAAVKLDLAPSVFAPANLSEMVFPPDPLVPLGN
ncbi:MAG: outer membrane lipoprotein-sorting protein [Opitutales bacterium]